MPCRCFFVAFNGGFVPEWRSHREAFYVLTRSLLFLYSDLASERAAAVMSFGALNTGVKGWERRTE